jgi:hypothetical protein
MAGLTIGSIFPGCGSLSLLGLNALSTSDDAQAMLDTWRGTRWQ